MLAHGATLEMLSRSIEEELACIGRQDADEDSLLHAASGLDSLRAGQ